MKAISTFLLSLALTTAALPATACSCILIEYFCQSLGPAQPVATGVVTKKYISGAEYMDLKVLEWLAVSELASDTISILGGNQANCQIELGHFSVGDTLILAPFPRSIDTATPYPVYGLSACAVTFLKIKNGRVNGAIREGVQQQSYSAFKADLEGCLILPQSIHVFPNPANDEITIAQEGGKLPPLPRFFNMLGQELQLETQLSSRQDKILVRTGHLSSGVYFATLDYGRIRHTLKWVKV